MEIVLCGEGGVGKTTIAAYLADIYANKGKNVILVDADSTQGLALFFGKSVVRNLRLPVIGNIKPMGSAVCVQSHHCFLKN